MAHTPLVIPADAGIHGNASVEESGSQKRTPRRYGKRRAEWIPDQVRDDEKEGHT